MSRYAATTKVPVAQSRVEIERTLKRYEADGFMYGEADGQAVVAFRMRGRHIKFAIDIPDKPQQERQRWRALLLAIKSKLESVESGIEIFEDAFMAQIVLPDGKTVGAFMRPQIKDAYEQGDMPKMLPHYGD
jgi:hypothetical protein